MYEEFAKESMGKRIHIINDEKWWMVKFCDYQYGQLNEESKSPAIKSHISLLKNHTLWIPYTRGICRDKEKEKEKVKEEEKDKERRSNLNNNTNISKRRESVILE